MRTVTTRTMYFIGVTTASSSAMKIFPLWMRELGRPEVVLEGVNLKIEAEPGQYRRTVERIKDDPLSPGALVTSHKIGLLAAARDLFDYLDPYAQICREVSSISKNGVKLEGHAKDPISAGACLHALLGSGYFGRTGGEVLCLGAGGAATAIVLHLATRTGAADRPRRIVLVDRSPARLEKLKTMVERLGAGTEFQYHCHAGPERNDRLLERLRPASLIINATGMGKDLPGSPLTDAAVLPENAIAWELNYRGELPFLRQALAQRKSRSVTVEDGWLYFLHGWTQVVSQVIKTAIPDPVFQKLAGIAARVTERAPGRRDQAHVR